MKIPDHDGIIRQLLARQKELERLIELLRSSAMNGNDATARMAEDNDLIDSVGNEVTGELLLLRATLQRLNEGSYGICDRCKGGISQERLQNYVYATLCSECADQNGGESGERKVV